MAEADPRRGSRRDRREEAVDRFKQRTEFLLHHAAAALCVDVIGCRYKPALIEQRKHILAKFRTVGYVRFHHDAPRLMLFDAV